MTFGGSPCPALWGFIPDTLADICNTLLHCKNWDYTSLYDPISDLISSPKSLLEHIPFHQSKDLSVTLPINDIGKVDIYIDDTSYVQQHRRTSDTVSK